MGRLVIAIVLIANLLVCPFRCMSCESEATVEGATARSACCCQPHDKANHSPSGDEQREHDCSCPNCICEGATLPDSRDDSSVDVEVAVAHWFNPTDSANPCWGISQATCATFPPRSTSGRAGLIAFQVWLI